MEFTRNFVANLECRTMKKLVFRSCVCPILRLHNFLSKTIFLLHHKTYKLLNS
jgi:hypothetical protein